MLVLSIVFAVGLGLRLDYAIRAPNEPVYDARAYARIATAISEGEGFTQGPQTQRLHLQPASNYTPGLPLLVAGVYEVRGGPNEMAARILLALLSSLAIPLAFFLGKRLGGPLAGSLAAIPVTIYPALLEYSGMLMTEPLGTTLLAATILAFLRAWEGPRRWPWALAGLLLGAMAMLRPEYLLLLAVLPAIALLRLGRENGGLTWSRVAPVALTVGCACLVVLPWTVRNFVVLDRFVPLSTGGGQVLYQGSYLPAGPDPEQMGPVFLDEHPEIRRELAPWPGPIYRGQAVAALAARLHPGENTDQALTKMALRAYADTAVEQPLTLASFVVRKVWHGWTAPARGVMRFPVWRVLQLALLLAAAVGLVVGLARRRFDAFVLGAILLTITLVQATYIASPRRTLVLLPEVSALAAFGLAWCASWVRGDSLARWRQ
jgi:4-amino-4-deoxy-L-arabinose transferase-like glycosyltransferase